MARNGVADGQLKQQQQQLAQQKFQWEQASHATDMQQRADQFKQEMDLRQVQAKAESDYRASMLAQTKGAREDASQARFEGRGGVLMPTSTDQPLPYETGGGQAPGQPSMLPQVPGVTVPPQAVGPAATQMTPEAASQNLMQGLPRMASPAIPMEGTLTADAQRPDPTLMNRVQPPLGAPAGQEAYIPTALGQAQQKKEAEQVNWSTFTPGMSKLMSDIGLEAPWQQGEKINPADRDLVFKIQEAKQVRDATMANKSATDEQKMIEERRYHDMQNLWHEQAQALKTNQGLSDSDIKANHSSVMGNLDSFHELSPKEKSAEREQLNNEGLPAPRKAGQRIESTEFFANRAIQSVNRIQEMLADPNKAKVLMQRIGPLLGREGNLEQAIGKAQGFPNTQEGNDARELLQNFRSLNNYTVFQEGQSLFGGRIPIQLMQQLQHSSPDVTKALPEFLGSLKSVKSNSEDALIAGERYRLDGKMRPNFLKDHNITGRTVKDVEMTNAPSSIANAVDEGQIKTFIDGKGQSHTVTKRGGKLFETVRE